MNQKIICGDCLEIMKQIPDKSVDMVLCDLPYGISKTVASWDNQLPNDPLFKEYCRIIKNCGAIVLTCQQPFTSFLVVNNLKLYKCSWIWEKSKASNFLQAKRYPLKAHEEILIFCKTTPNYYPQKSPGKPFKGEGRSKKGSQTELVTKVPNPTFRHDNTGDRFPRTIQYFVTAESEGCLHPTQKPIALFEYLIKTYTKEKDLILDNCAGSFTTAVACDNLNRDWICIEKEQKYCEIGLKRVNENRSKLNMPLVEIQ